MYVLSHVGMGGVITMDVLYVYELNVHTMGVGVGSDCNRTKRGMRHVYISLVYIL